MIVVLNFGGQYCHLIARRVRDLGVYSEVLAHSAKIDEIKMLRPSGIIYSGGPSSVYEKGAPEPDPSLLGMGIPILGICYGQQIIAKQLGAVVKKNAIREYGKKIVDILSVDGVFFGLANKEQVWMSHGDSVEKLPDGFKAIASTESCENAAIADERRKIYGLQFHPEVVHTTHGMDILSNFLFKVCNAKQDWNPKNLAKHLIDEVRKNVGEEDHVIMGTSGGVDSTVAAALIKEAIGSRLHCVFVDHGLIRKGEIEEVRAGYEMIGLDVHYVDAKKTFLRKLKGVTDPEKKRRVIGHTFIDVFEKKASELGRKFRKIAFLGQGTIYPDRIESAQPTKNASKIKSHHNLTLPDKMDLKVIEPLRDLYKDGVRKLGADLNIPNSLLGRHPFPGPGLAIRILGEVTDDRLRILREADYVFIEELKRSGWYDKTWQAFAALFPVKSVGVMGDARTYEYVIALRAVQSVDAMTVDWSKLPNDILEGVSNRIINEVSGVNRVLYDITQKPPGTIEYE